MGIFDLLAAIVAAVGGVIAVFVVARGRLRVTGARGEFVRHYAAAAFAALICAAMNALELSGGALVAAAVGNATNVLAPAMVWAGTRRVNLRHEGGTITAGAVSLLVLAATFVVAPIDATLIKTAAIAAFVVLAAAELLRGRSRRTPGAMLMAATLVVYAAFNVSRLVIASTVGIDSWAWNTIASQQLTTVLSTAVLLSMSIGAVRMGRALDDAPCPGTIAHARADLRESAIAMMDTPSALVVLTVRMSDFDLIRTAHGVEDTARLQSLLRTAIGEDIPEGVAAAISSDTVAVVIRACDEPADLESAVRARLTEQLRHSGFGDAPGLQILRHGIADAAQLDAVLGIGAPRAFSPWPQRGRRSRSARTDTPSAG